METVHNAFRLQSDDGQPMGLLKFLGRVGASGLPEPVLIGALLEAASHYNLTTEKISHWHLMGEGFLKGAPL